ncbi:right-handed parallel beta-helix repeat-containing protein [Sphingomonas sp. RB3P16]|uniref:right-handed parallel beta-helix repeat-containing protein n=1 Tax=Parasphingomonas frigoris TaxID=3096163 RepID=UPI002FCBD295
MQNIVRNLFACLAVATVAGASPAFAQATRTWISGVGDDANPCSRTAPCKTFAGAISKTAAGGEINVIDSGGFGGVTITKSITLRAVGVEAGVLAAGTNGIVINAAATDKIVLEGLDLEGLKNTGTVLPQSGVLITRAAEVLIRDCDIRNFDTGILVQSVDQARVTVDQSMFTGNNNGIIVASTPGFGHVKLFNSLLVGNTTDGVKVTGAGNDVFIANDQILGSVKSLDILSGGVVRSFGNNVIPTGDLPTTTTPLQ